MKTLSIKSLLTSLWEREGNSPIVEKRGEGKFFNEELLSYTFE